MTQLYDSEIERTILKFLQQSPQYLRLVDLDESFFYVEDHKKMFRVMKSYFNKYRRPLTKDVFDAYITQVDLRDLDKNLIVLLYQELQIVSTDSSQFDFFLERLNDFKIGRNLKDLTTDVESKIVKGSFNYKLVLKDLTSNVLRLSNQDLDSQINRAFIWEDAKERWESYQHQEQHPDELPGMSYGIRELDDITGGLRKTHLALFYGKTGTGKSRIMFNIAMNLVHQDYWVMVLSLEMARAMYLKCIDSREALLDYYLLDKARLDPENKRKYFEQLKQQKAVKLPLFIVDCPVIAKPSTVAKELELFYHTHGRFPDVVVIDYANLMESDRPAGNRSEKYDYIFQDLHLLGRFYNVSIITGAQERRGQKAAGKKVEEGVSDGTDNIGASNYMATHCEVVYHLIRDKFDEIENMIQIEVDKNRYGKSAFSVSLFAAWAYNYIGDRHLKLAGERVS